MWFFQCNDSFFNPHLTISHSIASGDPCTKGIYEHKINSAGIQVFSLNSTPYPV